MFTSITVKQVLRQKGSGYWGVTPRMTAYEALELMAEKDIGALPVIDEGRLVGIFSERDYARKVILRGKSSKTTTVAELMSGTPVTVGPEFTLRDCMKIMKVKNIRHLPVVQEGTLIGMVTISDVVNAIISLQDEEIEELENYIAGNEYPTVHAA